MKPHGKRILLTVAVFFASFAYSGAATAMVVLENGPASSISGSVSVRSNDRAVTHGSVTSNLSPRPFGRGEHSISGASLVQAPVTSAGSGYNWGKTIGISAGAAALALCLAALGVVGTRRRKLQLSV